MTNDIYQQSKNSFKKFVLDQFYIAVIDNKIAGMVACTDHEYIIEEVADTNTPAMNLYKKIGFKEYKRISVPQKRAEKIGINNFISLKSIKR